MERIAAALERIARAFEEANAPMTFDDEGTLIEKVDKEFR